MPDSNKQPSRFELYQAGKVEGRRSFRRPEAPIVEEVKAVETGWNIKMSSTAIIIALMVTVLLVLAAIAL